MWTKAQVKAHQNALAVARKHKAAIRKLEEMAKHSPAFAERMRELRVRRDNLEQLGKVATAIDPEGE